MRVGYCHTFVAIINAPNMCWMSEKENKTTNGKCLGGSTDNCHSSLGGKKKANPF